MRNPAFSRLFAGGRDGERARLRTAASGPTVDAFLPTLLLLVAIAAGFLAQPGHGRVAELLVVSAAVAVAYLARWRLGVAAAATAVAAFLAIEQHYGRLDGGHYWELVLYVFGIVGAVVSSAYVRFASTEQQARLERAQAQAEGNTGEQGLESLLSARSRLGALEYELDRSRRHSHRFALLIVRPDAATALPDGEELPLNALRPIAERIGTHVRAIDVAFRNGRHDFCVILPETPPEGARVAAERIRLALAGTTVLAAEGPGVELDVSIGIAIFPDDASSNEQLVEAATRALLHARSLGGNRTILHTAPRTAPAGWGVDDTVAIEPNRSA